MFVHISPINHHSAVTAWPEFGLCLTSATFKSKELPKTGVKEKQTSKLLNSSSNDYQT